jgi:hypothetical protein
MATKLNLGSETEFFSTSRIILLSFFLLIALLLGNSYQICLILGYLYYANKAMLNSGVREKYRGKKSRKGKEFWNIGD